MIFSQAHRKQLVLAGPLAVAVIALTVTACGGGGAPASVQGSAPGQWTAAEVSQFTAAAGAGGGDSEDSCVIGYFERDMSFGNAMAVVSVDPASGPSLSTSQVKTALVSKYGTADGDAINAQFGQTITDADNNCGGSAASSTAAAATPAPTADPAATSESSCTVDCANPVPSGESGWLAQVQGALGNVQQDLNNISSDASNDPDNLVVDGSQLEADAQATLDPNYDPPPADNADWVTGMNDYVTAGEDYSEDDPTDASQEIEDANSALASFNAANGGVLNGTLDITGTPASSPSAAPSSTPTTAPSSAPSSAATGGPVGTWNVDYGYPTVVYITESGSVYTITAAGDVEPLGVSCSLPAGTKLATFSATGAGTYSGQQGTWNDSNNQCVFAGWAPATLTLSGNTLKMPSTDPNDPEPITFIKD
jgi:hypothetical protein